MDALYRRYYGDRYRDIVLCGLVDEAIYESTTPKVVFILKEPHSDHKGWSIPCELNRNVLNHSKGAPLEHEFMRTWRQAGVWAYSVIHGFGSYSNLKADLFVAAGLKAIGMTNLKKTGGGASSSFTEISGCASAEKDLWQEEIRVMNPDLIVCGYTYWLVQKNLGLAVHHLDTINKQEYQYSVYDVDYRERGHTILDFWHPGIRTHRAAKTRNDVLAHLEILVKALRDKNLL